MGHLIFNNLPAVKSKRYGNIMTGIKSDYFIQGIRIFDLPNLRHWTLHNDVYIIYIYVYDCLNHTLVLKACITIRQNCLSTLNE